MRTYLEISLDSEEEKKLGMKLESSEYQNVLWTWMRICACFTDRQKASDQVNWTKLTYILGKLISSGDKED